jgi:hypothetical protein
MQENILINGPINVIRLEGTVFGIRKVLTVFMDVHKVLNDQTKCDKNNIIDIDDYLYKIIKNTDYPLDMFFEQKKSYMHIKYGPEHYTYLEKVKMLFKSEYKKHMIVQETKNQNKINKQSSSNSKVRLHYLDIRDIMGDIIEDTFLEIFDHINSFINNDNVYLERLGKIRDLLKNIIYSLHEMIDPFIGNKKIKETNKNKSYVKLIDKLKSRYHHKSIYENFDSMIKHIEYLKNVAIEKINSLIKNINEHYDKLKITHESDSPNYNFSEFIVNLDKDCGAARYDTVVLFSYITDIFFLRRFLDKDYITNAIVYAGAAHCSNYIYHLITRYNFNITHYSYSAIEDLDELNKSIKNIEHIYDYAEMFRLLKPPILKQCADVTSFPTTF